MIAKQQILNLNPCQKAVEWINGYEDMEIAWNECDRGDWMLWLISKIDSDDRKLTLAKARCAKLGIHLMKDKRSVNAVITAEKYGLGAATEEELADADYDATNAYVAANAATYADTDAVYANAADAANAAAAYATNAYGAAYGAAYATAVAYAAYADAYKKTLAKCANIVREIYKFEEIKEV